MKRVAAAAIVVTISAGACGDDRPGMLGNQDGGARPDGSQADGGGQEPIDSGAPVPDAPVDEGGPVVEVLSPAPSEDLSSDSIQTEARFTARCSATANPDTGQSVDASSVTMTATAGSESQSVSAQPTPILGEFKASFALGAFPNGPLSIRCTAADTAQEPATNSAQIETFLDLGPEVTVFNPPEDGAAFANQLDALFRVSPDPVEDGDTAAGVGEVELFVATQEMTVSGPDANMLYEAPIDFDDPRFTAPLDGPVTLTIRAANQRSPEPVTREVKVEFIADGQGPVIDVQSPAPGELVSGVITLTASISDPSGVNAASAVGTIAHNFEFDLEPVGGDTFEGTFDTRDLDTSWVYPPIEVRAQDMVGNQAAVGLTVGLDNEPPLVSLDPAMVREAMVVEGELQCSRLFDPLGDDATSDGESVAQLSEIRVRAEDQGNGTATSASGVVLPLAGVDESSVQLFVLDDETGALLVDQSGDGVCDAINPDLTPTSVPMGDTEAAVLDLIPISESGSSHFAEDATFSGGFDADCSAGEEDPDLPPEPLCISTPLTRVIVTELDKEEVIYSIPPTTELACMGNAFDSLATNISDGWACAATRAVDRLGNVGVSPPLRICFDADGDESECAEWGVIAPAEERPSCTDGCTPPPDFPNEIIRIDL